LGRYQQGPPEFPEYPVHYGTFGLGYRPNRQELHDYHTRVRARAQCIQRGECWDIPMAVYTHDWHDYFIRHDKVVPTLPPTAPMNPAKEEEERARDDYARILEKWEGKSKEVNEPIHVRHH